MGSRLTFPGRFFVTALVLAAALSSLHSGVSAQDIAVRAYLSPPAVGVGQFFTLNLEITGVQGVESEPRLPDLSEFSAYLGSGSSTSMQMAGGRTTVSLTIQYRFQALQEGTFEIPALSVSVQGESYDTDPVQLTISEAPPPEAQNTRRTGEPASLGPDDLFLTAEASRTRVREGEPLVVEYRIFTRVNVTSYTFTHVPEPQGFWVEEIPIPGQPQVEQVVRDGIQYTTAVIRRVALVPTGPGERTLEPLGIEAQVRIQRRSLDPFDNIFGMDRGSLFGTVLPGAAASNPITIEVEPLPPGRPQPFSGVVGNLTLSAALDQDSVDANQAVTLTVTASGEGNLRAVPDPVLDLPMDFEVYPPEISETVQPSGGTLRGTKSWEFVLIPRAPGAREIPPLSMGYFDTGAGGYRTAATGPLPLLVTGDVPERPSVPVRGGVATLREDIRFIHLAPARLVPVGRSAFGGPGFWVFLLLPMVAVLGAAALRVHRDRLEGDPAYARRRRAGRVAHARLAGARGLAGKETPREFYAEVAMALRGFVADKLGLAEAGMQMRELEEGLMAQGVSRETVREVTQALDHSDRQRFAPPEGDAEEEGRFLERVSALMTDLNREMGK